MLTKNNSLAVQALPWVGITYQHLPGVQIFSETAVAQWLRFCATNRNVAGSIPAGVSGFFIDIKSFRSHYGPWGGRERVSFCTVHNTHAQQDWTKYTAIILNTPTTTCIGIWVCSQTQHSCFWLHTHPFQFSHTNNGDDTLPRRTCILQLIL